MNFKLWVENKEEKSFNQALDVNCADWHLRLIYSDWLEEQGDLVLANAQRWMVTHKKCPEYLFRPRLWRWVNDEKASMVDISRSRFQNLNNNLVTDASLPVNIFNLLTADSGTINIIAYYHSREEAEQDLAQALGDHV